MSKIARIMQQATAGAAGDPLDIDNVFSTFLYAGNNSTQNIVNSIDLSTEGGMVWSKSTTYSYDWSIYDSARGATKVIASNKNVAEQTYNNGVTAFNTNGYSLGNRGEINSSSERFVSYTFRKAKNFFDIITYSGDDNSSRSISHSLGSTPGMIWIKTLNSNDSWNVFHRGLENGLGTGRVFLDESNAVDNNTLQFLSANSSSVTFAHLAAGNYSGNTYVMYLFAHNNNDGGFGPDGDKDVIKCGTVTTPSSAAAFEINLGFEPQLILYRLRSASAWQLIDSMQGLHRDNSSQPVLYPNQNYHSTQITKNDHVNPTPTGIKFTANSVNQAFGTNAPLIYMAIRRGSLFVPEDATKVFAAQDGRGSSKLYTAGFPVDSLLQGSKTGDNWQWKDRIRFQKDLQTDNTSAESDNTFFYFNDQTGIVTASGGGSAISSLIGYMWKRAPGYFDVATYAGNSQSSAITVNHNLGVVPEMMWVKKLDATGDWMVYHKDLNGGTNPHTYRLRLNSTGAEGTGSGVWNAAPTATQFSVGTDGDVNAGSDFVAYLFATAPGVSKVGSYSGTNNTNTIDCGFSNGAKLVIIKDISSSSSTQANWHVYDSARGIVSGNDGYIYLNSNTGEVTGSDFIDPHSSGFQLTNAGGNDSNASGRTYIFYAVA